jgi:hypothetical protein
MADTDLLYTSQDQGASVYISKSITWDDLKAELQTELSLSSDKIEEGNSSVEVIDLGTGSIRVTTDGTEHFRFSSDILDIIDSNGGRIFFSSAAGLNDLATIEADDGPANLRLSAGGGILLYLTPQSVQVSSSTDSPDGVFSVTDNGTALNNLLFLRVDDDAIPIMYLINTASSSAWDVVMENTGHLRFRTNFSLESLRLDFNGYVGLGAPNAAPTDGDIPNSQIFFYLDEGANQLKVRVRYSSGTLKTGTVALV